MATIINTVADLQAIANNMAGDYELGADINLSGVYWIPLGATVDQKNSVTAFTGTFDGKGHSIKNMRIFGETSGEQHSIGLFAELGNCSISNLVIGNAIINDGGYNPHVGILAGRAYYTKPTITNVSVDGAIIVNHVDSSSRGNPSIGGLIGCLYGVSTVSITDCISTVEIHVYGCNRTLYVGGFIGYGRELLMTRCFAFGDITIENTTDSGVNVSTMQSLCYYTEHVDCGTTVSIFGASANTVQTCGKYLTSSQEFTGSRNLWDGVTVPYETYTDNKITSLSQDDFIALTSGNSAAYNTNNVNFANGKYLKLAIDTPTTTPVTSYNITLMGQTFNGVKKVIYNGTVLKQLKVNGTTYTF